MDTYSIICPCYNESHRIGDTIRKFRSFIDLHPGSEVIFVDDGSKDDTAGIIGRAIAGRTDMLCVGYKHNRGKWGAIIFGTTVATKDFCVLSDADYSVDLSDIELFTLGDYVIIGERYHSGNNIPLKRRVPGQVFNFCVRNLVGIKYTDTQTPLKVWPNTKELRSLFLNIFEEGFAGDVEFLKRCDMQGIDVRQIPIKYKFVEGSSVNVKKQAPKMFAALLNIRKNVK